MTTDGPLPPRAARRACHARRRRRVAACLVAWLATASGADAQGLPAGPLTLANGRLTLGGQAAVSFGTADPDWYDYASYDYDLLRLFRLDATADLRVSDRVSILGDLRVLASTDSGHWLARPYALFARVRPFADRPLDLQAGLIPPVFGSFSRRAYETDNPLIGYPLAYQYLTSLRGDALPATVADLLRMRGRGWRTRYPVGNTAASEGLPLVDAVRYQSGVEAHAGTLQPWEASMAWTSGALSTPAYERGNGGKQVSARVAVRPVAGMVLGVSGSSGTFVSASLLDAYPAGSRGDQQAIGFDAEYSRDHWLLRSEAVRSAWRIPLAQQAAGELSLTAFGIDVEGRYRILPRLYAAARLDWLEFGDVAGAGGPTPWEWPVRRLQFGAGYSLFRNALVKVEWQHNRREVHTGAGASSAESYQTERRLAAQLVAWF